LHEEILIAVGDNEYGIRVPLYRSLKRLRILGGVEVALDSASLDLEVLRYPIDARLPRIVERQVTQSAVDDVRDLFGRRRRCANRQRRDDRKRHEHNYQPVLHCSPSDNRAA